MRTKVRLVLSALGASAALAAGACSEDPGSPSGPGPSSSGSGSGENAAQEACLAIDEARDEISIGLLELSLNSTDDFYSDEEFAAMALELAPTLREAGATFADAAGLTTDAELAAAIAGLGDATVGYADLFESGADRDAIATYLTDNMAFEDADSVIRPICFDIWNP